MIGFRQIALLFVVAAAGSGSTALTASNSVPDTVVGYGTSTITGATVVSIRYTLNGGGSQVTGADLMVSGDVTTGRVVQAGFGTDALTTCVIGNYNPGQNRTAVTCSGFTQNTSTATSFNVVVLNS